MNRMITLIAIDPGTAESAFVAMAGRALSSFGKIPNNDMLAQLDFFRLESDDLTMLVIEMVSTYGMPVGAEVFETCLWLGRFIERWRGKYTKILRATVKANLCHTTTASDSNIRAALLERYGGKEKAIGRKQAPGPLYGVVNDVWSALAVACTYQDRSNVGSGKGLGLLA